jgi:ATP-dependent DNA helicase RecQ
LETPLSILQRYWKHSQFRPLQEDIINSVLAGRDAFALLPTGGGKSVCFQVPGLLREGVCLVITPLIALMKDQVGQLKAKGIQAVAIYSGMSRQEIDVYLDNCVHGQVQFLYVSPERLRTELFQVRVKRMKISLIAVDEAHCISQWGYDFRPAYLQIAALRELLPGVPVLALTATATPVVKNDVIEKLELHNAAVFQQSFARHDLSLVVRKTDIKERKLLEILQKVKGSAIVYVRSRKLAQDMAGVLTRRQIKATHYHAGLTLEERTQRQEDWLSNHTRVMVSTNAFGMGIDKHDVRVVVHLDLPENLESYYQEAGRAGRDGLRAYAAVLYNDADIVSLQTKVEQAHPPVEVLQRIYQALANYYQLAVGSGEGASYDFDLHEFSDRFQLHPVEVYNSLRKLEEEGLLQFTESFFSPAHLHIMVEQVKLYEFQIANARFDPLIKMLMRLYGGELFSGYVRISESYIAKALQAPVQDVMATLKHLQQLGVLHYEGQKDKPQVTFVLPRQDASRLPLDHRRLEARKQQHLAQMKAMVDFVTSTHRCRMQLVQEYFGEDTDQVCGLCDVCVENRKQESRGGVDNLRQEIMTVLNMKPLSVEELEERIAPDDRELFVDVVRDMVDEGALKYDAVWNLVPKQKSP